MSMLRNSTVKFLQIKFVGLVNGGPHCVKGSDSHFCLSIIGRELTFEHFDLAGRNHWHWHLFEASRQRLARVQMLRFPQNTHVLTNQTSMSVKKILLETSLVALLDTRASQTSKIIKSRSFAVFLFPVHDTFTFPLTLSPRPIVDGPPGVLAMFLVHHTDCVLQAGPKLALTVIHVVLPLASVHLAVLPTLDTFSRPHARAKDVRMRLDVSLIKSNPLLGLLHLTVLDHLQPESVVVVHHTEEETVTTSAEWSPVRIQRHLQSYPLLTVHMLRVNLCGNQSQIAVLQIFLKGHTVQV
mmetsp:Transcript_32856/g.88185  ORF Transcript_32856/g.88185 Transcript_32856/m.88185 type:complete len:297 (+) Transcript_32856:417-1307(+)